MNTIEKNTPAMVRNRKSIDPLVHRYLGNRKDDQAIDGKSF